MLLTVFVSKFNLHSCPVTGARTSEEAHLPLWFIPRFILRIRSAIGCFFFMFLEPFLACHVTRAHTSEEAHLRLWFSLSIRSDIGCFFMFLARL